MEQLCIVMVKRTKQELENLRVAAKTLFTKDNKTAKDIAELLGVTEKTIGAWKAEGNWETVRTGIFRTKEKQLERLMLQLSQFNDAIEAKEDGKRFPDSKESDALKKLTSAIKDIETELNIGLIIDVAIEITNWMRTRDFKKSQEIAEVFDEYLKDKLK